MPRRIGLIITQRRKLGNRGQAIFVLYGGSFNPVHRGHVALVHQVLETVAADHLLVIPARVSPFKQHAPPLPDELRLAMLRAALGSVPRVSLLDVELRRPPPSYTIHTVRRLASQLPCARFLWAMGSDTFGMVHQWYHAHSLLELTGLLVVARRGTQAPLDAEGARQALPGDWPARTEVRGGHVVTRDTGRTVVRLVQLDLPAVASSDILRQRRLDDVPPAARPLLARYWREHPTG